MMVGFHEEGEVRDRRNAEAEENMRLTNVAAHDKSKEATKQVHWASLGILLKKKKPGGIHFSSQFNC